MQRIHSHQDIVSARRRVIARQALLRSNVNDRVLVNRANGVLVHTRLQVLFNARFDDPLEQAIHEIIVNHAYAAERLGPGGFDACIERLLELFSPDDGRNPNQPSAFSLSDIVGPGAASPTRPDVGCVLGKHLAAASPMTQAMLRQALDLAGFAGRIIIEKAQARPSIELVRGYTFDQAPAWPINVKLERPKVVCIDGYIESVSELHHLLEEASEAKEPVVLFLRGLADDVKNTLKVNYDRGSLRVVPIVVRFDMEGINVLNDVAVATGANLVSSFKGDLISNVRLADSVRVDDIVVHPTRVVVTSDRTRRAVEVHVAFLRSKRLDEKVDDVAQLFDARIKSLSPNHVVVRLPDDKDFVASAQAIDYALRAVKALVDHGTIDVRGQRMLTVTAAAARIHATRCYETLKSMGAVLTS